MPLIQRPGEPELFYEVDDLPIPGRTRPLILQHGYGRSSKFWFQWVPTLCRYFKVIRPGPARAWPLGQGFRFLERITAGKYVDDIRAIVRDLGRSAGTLLRRVDRGILGLAFAGAYPELVRSLALVSAPVFFSEGAARTTRAATPPGGGGAQNGSGAVAEADQHQHPLSAGHVLQDSWTGTTERCRAGVEMLARMAEFALIPMSRRILEDRSAGALPLSNGRRHRQPGAARRCSKNTCARYGSCTCDACIT